MGERRNTRLAGHSLRHEGMAYDDLGRVTGRALGRGKCSCGAFSNLLSSNKQRQRWHREQHKVEVVAQRGSES